MPRAVQNSLLLRRGRAQGQVHHSVNSVTNWLRCNPVWDTDFTDVSRAAEPLERILIRGLFALLASWR